MCHVRHLSVKGPSLLANQWVQRSEEGHWVEEEYFQESKKLAGEGGGGFVPWAIQHLAAVDREEALNCVIYW